MDKLLTIAIPTYNRAQLLDKQLNWLANVVQNFESSCEIIISDNCSTDNTQEIIEKTRPRFGDMSLIINRNPQNIGAVRNIAYCINLAKGKYVWTISDDDLINANALPQIIQLLTNNSDLSLIILNFSSRDMRTNKLRFERCFDLQEYARCLDGKATFENCLKSSPGGLALTTALVYRTDIAQQALQSWPLGLNNLAVQLYVTGFCALYGRVIVTQDSFLECAAGTHFWVYNLKLLLRLRYADMMDVYLKLMQLGYSSDICKQVSYAHFQEQRRFLFKQKFILKVFLQHPITTTVVLGRYCLGLLRLHSSFSLKRRVNPEAAAL